MRMTHNKSTKKVHVPTTGSRLWLYSIGAALLALLVYSLTLAGYVYPGHSTALFTQWMGMDALEAPTHPIWGSVVKAIGGMSSSPMASRLNVFSMICGVLSAGLLCQLVGFFVRQTVTKEETVKFVEGASVLAGLTTSCLFIFSTAVWQSSTHLEYHIFEVFLALVLLSVFMPMARYPKLTVLLSAGLGIGVAAGVVESVIFVALFPLFLLGVVVTAVRNGRSVYLPVGLFLFLFAVFLVVFGIHYAGAYLELPVAEAKGVLDRGDVIDKILTKSAHEMRGWIGGNGMTLSTSLGWLYILILAVLPFIACAFAAPRGLNSERTWSQYLFHLAMTVCAILAVATPLAPESLMRLSGHEPVATTALVCAFCGYLAAYWYLLARAPLPTVEYDKLSREVVLGHKAAPTALGVFLAVAVLASLVNLFSHSSERGTFADACANEILDRMGDRTWLITDGTLDDHLRVAAVTRGKELNLVCLQRAEDASYLKELAALVKSKGLKAGHAVELERSAELSVLAFLEDWLMGDPEVADKVAIFGAPDLWYKAELQPVPDCLFFSGVKDPKSSVDADKALADFKAFWEKLEPLLYLEGQKGSRSQGEDLDALGVKRLRLRRHVGLVANNLGVVLQDLGKDREAFELYELVLKDIDPDNICALFNEFEMARGKTPIPEAVARKPEIERQLRDIVKDPERRYMLWALSRTYGYIRSAEVLVRMGRVWARSAQRGEALAQIRQAIDLVPPERQAGLLNMMAAIYASGNQTQKSREVYEKVLEEDATNHDALIGLMNLALQRGEVKEAQGHLQKALDAAPNGSSSSYEWALLHLMKGDFGSARMTLQGVTDTQPKSLRAWSLLAGVLLQQHDQSKNRTEQANLLEELESVILPKMEAVAESPSDYYVLMTRAFVLMRRGDDFRERARDTLFRAYKQRPTASAVGDMLLNLDIALNDGENAGRHARLILERDRGNKLANYAMGSLALKDGDYAKAEYYLRRSADNERPIPAALNDLAEVLHRLQKFAEAEKFARAATEAAPDLYVAWETLGSSLLDQGKDLDKAEEYVQRAIELSKKGGADDVRMLITLVRVQFAKKDLARARGTLRTIRANRDKFTAYDLGEIEKLEAAAEKGK